MKRIVAAFALLQLLLLPASLSAQQYAGSRVVSTTSWIEEWDPVDERWVRVDEDEQAVTAQPAITTITTHIVNGTVVAETHDVAPAPHLAARYAVPQRAFDDAPLTAQYGPFRVIDPTRAALIGSTGAQSPAQFDAMMRDHPLIKVIEMVEAPGTRHDIANLALGRRIRAAGLRTHVPQGGSVRSGAVELFLAGATRTMDPGAQFAVHSWLDNYGREPDDFAPDAPENRLYLDYYVEMGMNERRARDFYAMTNSVPHSDALWMRAEDMASWIAPRDATEMTFAAHKALSVPLVELQEIDFVMAMDQVPMIAYQPIMPSGAQQPAIAQAKSL